jgi:hypothetical protein
MEFCRDWDNGDGEVVAVCEAQEGGEVDCEVGVVFFDVGPILRGGLKSAREAGSLT